MIVGTGIRAGSHHGQVGAHVHVRAGRHGVVEGEDRVGERLDHVVVGRARVIPGEDAAHEGPVDRAPVLRPELRQALSPLRERRAPLARPDEGVERQAPDALGMALGEQGRAEGSRRDPVRQVRADAPRPGDVVRRDLQVVGAGRDVGVDVAVLVRPSVALHVDAPRVVAESGKVVHRRRIGSPRDLEVEGRLGAHRGPVDEENRPSRLRRRGGGLLPEEQAHRALLGPVFTSEDRGLGGHGSSPFWLRHRTRCRRGRRTRSAAPDRPRWTPRGRSGCGRVSRRPAPRDSR